jgi:endonuclease G, mitochondrial
MFGLKKKSIACVLSIALIFSGCVLLKKSHQQPVSLLPVSKIKGELIEHTHYRLFYSEEHEGAFWVFYRLTPEYIDGIAKRKDNFRIDPKVSTGSAHPDDYKSSGFDRGHLCPAASMTIDQSAMDESFFMSNMSPQHPSLNRGRWQSLEDQVRKWVHVFDSLYVVTGPVFDREYQTIGENKVAVPTSYYKIMWDGGERIIGFLLPNQKCPEPLAFYTVPVDSIEKITGFDFFSIIPDNIENIIESTTNVDVWFGDN